MTDWDRVERLRSKGLGWDSIAEDPKVGFSPPEGAGSSGRVLKAMYLQRRATSSGRRRKVASEKEKTGSLGDPSRSSRLFLYGLLLLVAGLIWTGFGFAFPGTIGLIVPVVPYLILLDIAG